jgi:hypothetical protein
MKSFSKFWAFGLFVCVLAGALSFSSPASADPNKEASRRESVIEATDQRVKTRFEEDMRNAYATEHGVDDMSLITSSGNSTCVSGTAVIKAGGYTEYFMLAYCFGETANSFYGDFPYENAYLNDYVVDGEWNWVHDFWTDVNIGGLTMKGSEFTLQDEFFAVSFNEIKKAKPRKTRSSYVDDAGDDAYYSYRSRGTYVPSTVSGFDFYLEGGEPTALIRRTTSRYSETCVETESGYCGGKG